MSAVATAERAEEAPGAPEENEDPRGGLGKLEIAERVVEKVVRQAMREVSRAGGVPRRVLGQSLGSVKPDDAGRIHADVDGKLVTLAASMSVEYPQPIVEVVNEVRQHVIERVQQMLALDVVRFDIDIPHLFSADQAKPPVERVQ